MQIGEVCRRKPSAASQILLVVKPLPYPGSGWKTRTERARPEFLLISMARHLNASGLVGLSADEPKVSGLDQILVAGRWLRADEPQTVLIPERMAEQLNIDLSRPLNYTVTLWGMPFKVVGIFSGKKLQQRIDLDGEPLTPVIFPREMSSELTEVRRRSDGIRRRRAGVSKPVSTHRRGSDPYYTLSEHFWPPEAI